MAEVEKHYLQAELDKLFRTDDQMWSFLQRGSLDGVWYWDLEKPDNEWMSSEMWQLFGIDPETKRHDPSEWQDIIFEEDLKVALENFEKHCADPSHPYDQIVRYRHADGSTVWVRCRGVAIRDETGKPIRMLGAHNDYTPVKRAEELAQIAERKTAAANEELSSFAYSTSHDLKSPSNTVDMLLREVFAADEGGLSDDQRDLLETAHQTIGHMRRLVDDLLSYTRLVGQELQHETVSVNDVVTHVTELLSAAIQQSDARIEVKPLPELPLNRMQVTALFQNIVENAIKYRHPDRSPNITIDVAEPTNPMMVAISVTDNGIGIDPKHQSSIFELLKRLHRSDELEGSGLGLTLCRRVMFNHGGTINVQSEQGQWTRFTVEFPRYQK